MEQKSNTAYKWRKIFAAKAYGGKEIKLTPIEAQELIDDIENEVKDDAQNGNDFIADVSTRLSLDNFIINPRDKDDDFEIEIEGDFQGDAYAYLNKEQAIKLAKYILKSFNVLFDGLQINLPF